jgi:hypothetical protein
MEAAGFDPRTSRWRVFGAESAFFGILLFLVRLTPATPNLVEFCWGKEEGVSYWHIFGYRKPFLTKFWMDFGSLRPSGANGAGFRAI